MVDHCLEIALKAHGGQHDIDGNRIAIAVKLNDLHHNLERGRKMGYQALVEKHETAIEIFKSIEL